MASCTLLTAARIPLAAERRLPVYCVSWVVDAAVFLFLCLYCCLESKGAQDQCLQEGLTHARVARKAMMHMFAVLCRDRCGNQTCWIVPPPVHYPVLHQ